MVYGGKPSRGCQNCKKSHIKCDEKRPQCSLCVKRKLVCPGYQDAFDLVLRDQTSLMEKKAKVRREREKSSRSPESTPSPPSSQALQIVDHQEPKPIAGLTSVASVPIPVPSLDVNIEQYALCYFFTTYILHDHNKDAQRGHFEFLLPSMQASSRDDPISIITTAVSMLTLVGRPGMRFLEGPARQKFGEGLRSAAAAINDPEKSKQDATLMAVLMLSFGEGLIAVAEKKAPTHAHAKGAVALVKHRGVDNFSNETSRGLLLAVRTSMINQAILHSQPVEAFPSEWKDHLKQLPHNAASNLTMLGEDVAFFKAAAHNLLHRPDPDDITTNELQTCLTFGYELERKFGDWVFWFSERSTPAIAADISPEALEHFDAYSNTMHVYTDISHTNVWNAYRLQRLAALNYLVGCEHHLLRLDPTSVMPVRPEFRLQTMRQLVDDICASVPFSLGDRGLHGIGLRTTNISYPWFYGEACPARHHRKAVALGGWFLAGPLSIYPTLDMVTPYFGEPVLPRQQKIWMARQLVRCRSFYGVDEGSKDEGAPAPTNATGQALEPDRIRMQTTKYVMY